MECVETLKQKIRNIKTRMYCLPNADDYRCFPLQATVCTNNVVGSSNDKINDTTAIAPTALQVHMKLQFEIGTSIWIPIMSMKQLKHSEDNKTVLETNTYIGS